MEYSIFSSAYNFYHKPFPAALRPLSIEDNLPFSSETLSGKISVINCWFYGCRACMMEIEELREMMPRFKKENDVQFISFFRDPARMEDGVPVYFNEKHLNHKSWFSEENKTVVEWSPLDYDASHYYNFKNFESILPTPGYPVTFITDKEGIVRYIFNGGGKGVGKEIYRQLRLWQGFVPVSHE